eukprot:scaffold22199_cov118-Isochrysis_galbana.AAC.5
MARVGDDVGWRWSGGARSKQRDQIGHRLKLVCAHPLYVRDRAAPFRSARRMVVFACVFVRARACVCACDRVCAAEPHQPTQHHLGLRHRVIPPRATRHEQPLPALDVDPDGHPGQQAGCRHAEEDPGEHRALEHAPHTPVPG